MEGMLFMAVEILRDTYRQRLQGPIPTEVSWLAGGSGRE